ncbi:hypothetical protein [Treponema primitia]|uniref:hypothetical protein n=1 Tax=Treponema primitia TaxID=88058 RepID=UPI000255564C|nr:hypothetical protein [Treponema primitia]
MRRFLLLIWLVLPVFPGFSQDHPSGISGDNTPYIIPQTIFVGDKGRLVFPLGSAFAGTEGAVIQGAGLPRSNELVINRVELERRGTAVRLLVDFQAYVPGLILLPPIEIASHTFTGLEVNISSILSVEQRGMVLSGPAEPLTAPGTAVMIYGTILGIILLLLALTLGGFWGKTRLGNFAERLRRRQVIRAMGKSLRRLRNTEAGKEGETLEALSGEFRSFLGILTGTNCRAMVPRELLALPALGTADGLSPAAISDLFRRCDTLRFSGESIERELVSGLLDEFKELTGLLETAEKEHYSKPGGAE